MTPESWRQSALVMRQKTIKLQKTLKQVQELQHSLNNQKKSLEVIEGELPRERHLLNTVVLNENQVSGNEILNA